MKRNIIIVMSFLILVGIIALSLNLVFGMETVTYLQKIKYEILPGQISYYYKFNFAGYLKNLNTTVSETSNLTLQLPTRQWQTIQGVEWWVPLGNNLALMLDYLLLLINVVLYPLRVGAYLARNMIAILGINTNETQYNGLYWLVELLNWLIERIAIPYI